ncbi:MAG: hypothetical protein KH093_07735 [Roseburia sp.]|uniref:Uncharacterized protein n=1 Tax=Blautia argi TaxID=1912897 RepID=A0A2Z4UAF3_9FIRM|nr:hypothetical protein [Blautia argi]AWY97987.1 hypothetical protein DQQ01_07370 [Blautia argi]MBS7145159.1 hypothetical protein [Roseburia sp.]
MDKWETLERKGKKGDILLKMIAISGEMPANLPEKIVGSKSYTASLITDLKKKGYLLLRYREGLRGYVLGKKGKNYLLQDYRQEVGSYLIGASETNHVKSELEKRLRLHRMSQIWGYFFMHGNLIFATEKPKIFTQDCYGKTSLGTYYGSQELKQGTDQVKGSRACGLYMKNEEVFVVYNSMGNLMKWSKKMETAMRCWVERNLLKTGITWQGKAILFGDSMKLLRKILLSSGGVKQELFQTDDVYEQYYFVPQDKEGAYLQIELLTDKERSHAFSTFLETILDEVERNEFPIYAGLKKGIPVYFVYELELRKLQMVKQDMERRGRGMAVCFDYQQELLKDYYGEGVEIMVLDCEKVKQYLLAMEV